MRMNPVTLKPEATEEERADEKHHADETKKLQSDQSRLASSEALKREIDSPEGQKIIGRLLNDFESTIDSLDPGMGLDELQIAVGKLC